MTQGFSNTQFGYGLGAVVQVVYSQDGEAATTTTTIDVDDTIPQNTEGLEVLTASITPTNVNNKLKIEVVVHLGTSIASTYHVAALFQDSTADALACMYADSSQTNGVKNLTFTHWMDAGTISSTTFKVRAGIDSAGTATFNGDGGVRQMGGNLASSITITEIAA